MKRILWILLTVYMALPLCAQNVYISNSRSEADDRFEDLDGKHGFLLLSKHNDLIISVTNATNKVSVLPKGARPDGYNEYYIIIDANDTKNPKVEVSRRGSVYKTDFTTTKVKPDYLLAYRVVEVQTPIRMDDQTKPADAHLNAAEAEVELTTTIKGLKVECSPKLGATIHNKVSSTDPNITITDVVFPVTVISKAKEAIKKIQAEAEALGKRIDSDPDKAKEMGWYDEEAAYEQKESDAKALLAELSLLTIQAEGTNQLPIDISDMGPRVKRRYAILPLIIEKNVFVTQCSAFMSEGGKLFGMRKYKEARIAYDNALKSRDVVISMRPAIRESIAQCDTCIQYESWAGKAINRIKELQKSGIATQDEVAKYASAAVEFMQMVNTYNPDEFYTIRIKRMEQLLTDMPLKVKFTIVEWLTLNEGKRMPGVEIWAYHGHQTLSSNTFSSDRKFKSIIRKEGYNYKQIGRSNEEGIAEIELDRTNMPDGFIFRPDNDSNAKIKYMTTAELLRQAQGTYMEKQFRLKMYTK